MKASTRTPIAAALLLAVVGASSTLTTGCAETKSSESTGQYIDDSTITTKVKAGLANASLASSVGVTTYKGVVQLSGFVNSSNDKQTAERVASYVEGVKEVRDDIQIKPTP